MKKKSIELKLYAIRYSSNGEINVNDDKGVCYYPNDIHNLNGSALIHEDYYDKLFGIDRQSTSYWHKRLSIVEITREENNKTFSIYRKFYPVKSVEMKGKIAVTYHDILFLKEEHHSILKEDVYIEKGSILMFFLKHPNEVVYISFVVSVLSLLIALLSIILTIILL